MSGFSLFAQSNAVKAAARAAILPLLASGAVKPIVERTYKLEESAEALRHPIEDRPFGRVVVAHDEGENRNEPGTDERRSQQAADVDGFYGHRDRHRRPQRPYGNQRRGRQGRPVGAQGDGRSGHAGYGHARAFVRRGPCRLLQRCIGQPAALALAVFLVPATLVFHAFWSAPPAEREIQLAMFAKNLAILGGLLLIAVNGSCSGSLAAPRPSGDSQATMAGPSSKGLSRRQNSRRNDELLMLRDACAWVLAPMAAASSVPADDRRRL